MPRVLRDYVDKYHLKGDDVIAMVATNDFEEVVLKMAVIALKLNIDPHFTYFKANLILDQKPIDSVIQFVGQNIEDPISESIRLTKEVSKEIQDIKDALLSGTQSL